MNLRQDKRTVHIGIALDESGSMESIKKEVIEGLNEQIQEAKKHSNVNTTITWVTFAGAQDVKTKLEAVPISELKEIDEKDFNPNGATAMYDGVAKVINIISNKTNDDELTSYLILVVSDGGENASIEYNSKTLAELIKPKIDTKRWNIVYIGANQDLTTIKQSYNLTKGSTLGFAASSLGTRGAIKTASASTGMYLSKVANLGTNTGDISYTAKLDELSLNYFTPEDNPSADTK